MLVNNFFYDTFLIYENVGQQVYGLRYTNDATLIIDFHSMYQSTPVFSQTIDQAFTGRIPAASFQAWADNNGFGLNVNSDTLFDLFLKCYILSTYVEVQGYFFQMITTPLGTAEYT